MTLHAGEARAGDGAADDKVVGTITSAAWSAELGAWVALGYLHRNVEAPGPVRVRSGDGIGGSRPVQVALLPLVGSGRRRARLTRRPVPAAERPGGRRTASLLAARCRLRAGAAATTRLQPAGQHPDRAPDRRRGGPGVVRWPLRGPGRSGPDRRGRRAIRSSPGSCSSSSSSRGSSSSTSSAAAGAPIRR